jgi:outer membrane lipase/esterase
MSRSRRRLPHLPSGSACPRPASALPPGAALLGATLLGAAVAVVPVGARAQGIGDLVAFGDSLTDDGNAYRLTLLRPEGPIPPSPPYFEGRFSNGPVWVERLAPLLGATGLEGRAFGGAESGSALAPPGIRTQVAAWLGTGGRPGGDDLLVVWGGGNDYRFGYRETDPAALVARTVDNLGASVAALAATGARDILVPNLPDLGATPEARAREATEPGTAAKLTALTQAHNAQLAQRVEALRATFPEATIRVLDVEGLFQALRADPAAYGLANLTVPCLLEVPPGAVVASGACPTAEATDATLFYDPVHPTAATHALLAQHAAAVLAAPGAGAAGAAAMPELGMLSGSSLGRAVARRLADLRGIGGLVAGVEAGAALGPQYASAGPVETAEVPGGPGAVLPGAAPDPDRPFGIFAYADRRWGDRGGGEGRAGFSYRETNLAVGADYRLLPGLVVGAAVGHGWGRASLSAGAGSAEIRSLKLGAYAGLDLGAFRLDAEIGYAFDDYPRIDRATGFPALPVAEADTSGRTVSAALTAGYDIPVGIVTLTPYAGLDWRRSTVDGYRERGAGPYAVEIGGQAASALGAEGGARLSARIEQGWGTVEPRLSLGYRRELSQELKPVTVSLGGIDRRVARASGDRDNLVAGAGLALDLAAGVDLAAGYEGTLGLSDGRDHALTGRIRARF